MFGHPDCSLLGKSPILSDAYFPVGCNSNQDFKLCYQPGSHTVTGHSSISKWHGPIAIFAERHRSLVR